MIFGEKLSALRKSKGLTQEDYFCVRGSCKAISSHIKMQRRRTTHSNPLNENRIRNRLVALIN